MTAADSPTPDTDDPGQFSTVRAPAADSVADAFHYDAFISYSRRNVEAADKIEGDLEGYPLPRAIRKQLGRRHLNVFRDQSDLTGNRLTAALEDNLKRSRTLVVLCSPAARESTYVGIEINRFAQLRDANKIVPTIVAGVPNNERGADPAQWAFPDSLAQVLGTGSVLGPDLRTAWVARRRKDKVARGSPWIQLVADILQVKTDELTERIAKAERRRMLSIVSALMAIILGLSSLTVWAMKERSEAQRQANVATSRQLAASAENMPAASGDLALGLAVAARSAAPTLQSNDALLATLTRNPQLVRFLHGTTGPSGVVAVAPDDLHAAGGGFDGQVVQWDLTTGAARALSDGGNRVQAITYSPSGQLIFAVRDTVPERHSSVEVWDARTGEHLANHPFENVVLDDVAALDESTVVVSGGQALDRGRDSPGVLSRWQWRDDQVRPLPAPRRVEHVAAVSGGLMVSLGEFPHVDQIAFVDAATGSPRWAPIAVERGSVNDIDASPNGHFAAVTTGPELTLIDVQTGNVEKESSPLPEAFAVRFVGDGSHLAVLQDTATSGRIEDHAIHLYTVPSLTESGPTIPSPSNVGGLAALHKSAAVLSAREGGGAALWNVAGESADFPGRFSRLIAQVQLTPSDTAFTPDGALAISTGPRDLVVARDWATGQPRWPPKNVLPGQFVNTVEVSPNGRVIAVGGGSSTPPMQGVVVLMDPASGSTMKKYPVGAMQVNDLAFAPDGEHLFVGMRSILGIGTGSAVTLELATGHVSVLDPTPPVDLAVVGDRLAWLTPKGELAWCSTHDAVAGCEPHRIELGLSDFGKLAATGRGLQAVVSAGDRVGIVDLGSEPTAVRWLGHHRGDVSSVSVNSSSTVMASADYEGNLIFWDLTTAQPLTTPSSLAAANGILGLFATFTRRAQSSDLLLASPTGIRAINGDPHSWPTLACALANRGLTRDEWTTYVGDQRPYRPSCS